jgi:hypothetical protein
MFIRFDGTVAPCINLALGGPTTFLGRDTTIPSVHYGRLPEDDLMDLWESSTSQLYRQRFEQRAQKHDQTLVNPLFLSSGSFRKNALQSAKENMPDPPQGCNVCHYLYDI